MTVKTFRCLQAYQWENLPTDQNYSGPLSMHSLNLYLLTVLFNVSATVADIGISYIV